jgi:hypothetical protein
VILIADPIANLTNHLKNHNKVNLKYHNHNIPKVKVKMTQMIQMSKIENNKYLIKIIMLKIKITKNRIKIVKKRAFKKLLFKLMHKNY